MPVNINVADCKIRAGFSGWSVYQKLDFSLKINISLHNWTSKHICSIRYTEYVYIFFWTPRKWLYQRRKNSRRSRPPSAADFLCCFGVLNTIISWESKIKYTHIEYISWNIFFSRSNYVFKNRFLMNFAEFWEFGRLGVGWPGIFKELLKCQENVTFPNQACPEILGTHIFWQQKPVWVGP